MKRNYLLLPVFVLCFSLANAQDSNPNFQPNPNLSTIEVLNDLSGKIEKASVRLGNSVKSSRAEAAESRDALDALYAEYRISLEKELLYSEDAQVRSLIEKEIDLLDKHLSKQTNSSQK